MFLFWRGERSGCDEHSQYHQQGWEVWYPNGFVGETPEKMICRSESKECSHSKAFWVNEIGQYLYEHKHYFGHKVDSDKLNILK